MEGFELRSRRVSLFDVKEALDEAAREFPKDLPVSEKTTEDDLWKNFHERNVWFKQYFGGESK
jgi:hypothetical protein